MESDITDITGIINDTIIMRWRQLLWVTTKTWRSLRDSTERSIC